jgi:ATP-dependent helicase/nuclease subunit A
MKNFLIYRSSAGSGKTYTLVKEYLKLVLTDPTSFRGILAVTFTNKAAEEMKSRIIKNLEELSMNKNERLKNKLTSEGVKGDISSKAAMVLQKILHQYSYFSVSTIDSFFHRVIRSFAKELKLQLGFEIEMDLNIVLDKVVDELLDEIDADNELRKYLEEFVFHNIDEDKGWKFENSIKDISQELFKERYWIKRGNEEDLSESRDDMKQFIKTLFMIVSGFENRLVSFAEKAIKLIGDCGLEISDFKHNTASYFVKLANRDNYPDNFEPTKTVIEVAEGNGNWYTQKSTKKAAIEEAANNGLQKLLQDVVKTVNTELKKYISAAELIKTIYILGVFRDLLDKLKEYRDENRVMLISDTNNILTSVISSDNSPFVYEKIGNTYRHFLIDEFQDTSTFQWRNFLPLMENSLSENNFSMIVGDVKQSIYRWRNGNPKLLLSEVKKDLAGFEPLIKEEALDQNYRSRKALIAFNNEFFRHASTRLSEKADSEEGRLILDAYRDAKQLDDEAAEGGLVRIEFTYPDEEKDISSREVSINRMISCVERSLAGAYNQRDMMVLVRSKAEGREAAYFLTEAGYKVVSGDSLLLTNSPRVKLLVNLMKYISNPQNLLARAEVLYNYVTFIKRESSNFSGLHEVFIDHNNGNTGIFRKLLPREFFDENTDSIDPKFSNLNLYELAEDLVRIFQLNAGADTYLLRFLDMIKEYSTKYGTDVTAFAVWWDENKEDYSIIVPESEDAIKVMTIHKAKGLESPVVIIPFCNWDMNIRGGKDYIWAKSSISPFDSSPAYLVRASEKLRKSVFEKDYIDESVLTNLDNLNLMYVAFTRASELLFINIPSKGSNIYNTGKLISEVAEKSKAVKSCIINDEEIPKFTGGSEQALNLYKINKIISGLPGKNLTIKSVAKDMKLEDSEKLSAMKSRGIVIHKALSYINTPADIVAAIQKVLIEGLLKEDMVPEIRNEIEEIIKIPEVKMWFSGDMESKPEAELILPDGRVLRPDRVLLKNKKAIVIDYKSGSKSADHKAQLTGYSDALRLMGYTEIEKYLLYITAREVVKVT